MTTDLLDPPSRPSYREFIDLLHVVISMYSQNGLVLVMGDFNAYLQDKRFIKNTDVRGKCLLDLMRIHTLLAINTLPTCTGATSSFVSYGDLYESLIDHILLPVERLDTALSCEILEDHVLNVSRHLPVGCSVCIPSANLDVNNFEFPSHVKLDKLNEELKQSYQSDLEVLLIQNVNVEGLTCHETLNTKYVHIADCITRSSDSLPKTKFKPSLKPYWDSVLKMFMQLCVRNDVTGNARDDRGECNI